MTDQPPDQPNPNEDYSELLGEDDSKRISQRLTSPHPAVIAEALEKLDTDQAWELLGHAPIERQAAVFGFVSAERQQELVSGAGTDRMCRLLEAMPHDDRVDLLKALDTEVVEGLLPFVGRADREDIRKLMAWPEDQAGSVMTTDYAWLRAELSAENAIAQLREQAPGVETIYYVYVLDEKQQLVGFVSLRDLILADPQAKVKDVMTTDLISVRPDQDQEEVAQLMAKYDLLAMPVVDEHHRLIGILTHDDIADVLQVEATRDFHLTAAVAPLARSYHETRALGLYRRRVGWLVALVGVNLVSTGIIERHEDMLATVITLAFFIPLLIDSGGNTGSQAATLMVRAIGTGEVKLRQWFQVMGKELAVGLSLGVTMAAASFLLGAFRGGEGEAVTIGLIVGFSMLAIVLVSNVIGTVLPFILTKLRIDPAVASSPLITTIADAAGLFIYFTIAAALHPAIPAWWT